MTRAENFFVRFWGVRGSIPCPGSGTIEYGGNSTCLEIRADGRLIIVDFGSGIMNLSRSLMENDLKKGGIKADIFVTHTHMDHLVGFPMFLPFFLDSSHLCIYGPVLPGGVRLRSVFENEFSYEYWPVKLDELASNITFRQLRETTVDMGGGLTVSTKFINHTVTTIAFRFDYKGKSIATYFDTETLRNPFPEKEPDGRTFYDEDAFTAGELAVKEENGKLLEFFKNTDVLIHDSQYTEKEYITGRLGWGHSTFKTAIETGIKANVKKLVLFHYNPMHTDGMLREFEQEYKEEYKTKSGAEIIWAREGLTITA